MHQLLVMLVLDGIARGLYLHHGVAGRGGGQRRGVGCDCDGGCGGGKERDAAVTGSEALAAAGCAALLGTQASLKVEERRLED
jgi:hypothetical protein